MRVPAGGGDIEDLFEGDFVRIEPVSNRIYHGKAGQSGIFARSLEGNVRSGPEELLLRDYVPPRGFDVNKDGIYYPGRDAAGNPAAIRFFEFA